MVLSALLAASPGLSSSAGFTVVWPGSNFKNVVEVLAPHGARRAFLPHVGFDCRRGVLSRPQQMGTGYTSCPASIPCPNMVGSPRATACSCCRSEDVLLEPFHSLIRNAAQAAISHSQRTSP